VIILQYLAAIKTPVSYAFVTNSGEEDARELERLAEPLRKMGRTVAVMVTDEQHAEGKDQVVANRNVLREYFLKGNWEYLFSLDSDCVGPTNALEVLRQHNKKLATGWYLAGFNYGGKERILPLAYAFDKPGHARQLSIKDVLIPRFMPIAVAGLGCALIHRSILEQVSFTRNSGTEDAAFYTDARDKTGEKLWLDTRVAFWHLKFPPGDKRNNVLDPRRYQLKKK